MIKVMKKNAFLIIRPILLLLPFILFFSCSIEKKIAIQYISKRDKGAVLIIGPEIISMLNLKDSIILNNGNVDQNDKDSLMIKKDLYLKYLNGNTIISISLDLLKQKLYQMGFRVYDDSTYEEFMNEKDSSFILNLAQVEFEEGYGEQIQTDYIFGEKYDAYVNLNFVNINSWFELERKNLPNELFPILFCSFSLTDHVDGYFNSDDYNQIEYIYKLDTLSLNDFQIVPEKLAEKYANYFYDYVMNLFIMENLPENKTLLNFYHYNTRSRKVIPQLKEGEHFIEMEH